MGRAAGAVALGLVALVALVVGGALTLLRTSQGSELARRVAVEQLNQRLAGRIEVRRFRFGGDRVLLEGIVLREAEGGAVVARVRRIDVDFRPLALFRKRLDLRRVAVAGPELHLVLDARGSNLERALAPRQPPAPAPTPTARERPSGGPRVAVGRLELTDGVLDVRDHRAPFEAPLRHVRVASIDVRGAGELDGDAAAFRAQVGLTGTVEAPLGAPLAAQVTAQGRGERREAALVVSLDDGGLEATAETHRDPAARGLAASARVGRLRLTPRLAGAFLPELGLAAAVDATATATLAADVLHTRVRLTAAGGAIEARGVAELGRARLRDLTVEGRDVDLGAVVAGLPRSALTFDLHARGGGRDLQTADGELALSSPGGRLGGYALGAVRLRARAARGRVDVSELRADLPGLSLNGGGWARAEALDLRASIDATDLARTVRSLAPALPTLRLAGRGRVEARASGSTLHPALTARARFSALAIGGARMRDVAAALSVADRRVTADLRMKQPQPLALHVAGRWDRTRGVGTLAALELAYPEARWRLVAPVSIAFDDQRLRVDRLELRTGAQAIELDVQRTRARLDASLAVKALELAGLPQIARPRGQVLAGRLDAQAHASGDRRWPDLEARVDLTGGRLGRYRDLALALRGRVSRSRAAGSLSARGLSTALQARFDLPLAWPPRDRRAPVDLSLDLAPTDLGAVAKALGQHDPALRGRARVSLRITGTGADPLAHLDATARGLAIAGVTVGDAHLTLAADGQSPTTLRLELPRASGPAASPGTRPPAGVLSIETPLSLGRLLRERPSAESLLRAPFTVRGDLREVPLAAVARALGRSDRVRGTASLRVAAQGTARAPTGALNLTVSGAARADFPPTDARVDVALGERDTRIAARVWRQGRPQPLAALSATWGMPAARLLEERASRAKWADAPLDVRLAAGPAELRHRPRLATSVGQPQTLGVHARADVTVTGTLRRPVVDIAGTLADARLADKPIGAARLRARYADARAHLDLAMSTVGGGTLHLQAAARAELGYPNRLGSFALAKLPVEASLDARAFDLGWLSGLGGKLRRVGGQLDAAVRAEGPLTSPAARGRLEWKHGELALAEIGEYRDVRVALHGDARDVWLDELRAASGDGRARLTGHLERMNGRAQLTLDADLSRFPLYRQGQVLATLSTKARVNAGTSAARVEGTLRIDEAHVVLSELKKKNLQPLARPDDVVLVSGGRPLDRAEAKKLSKLEALEAARHGVASGPAVAGGDIPAAPEERPPMSAHVGVAAPRNLWIRGKDTDLELGLGPNFKIETAPELRIVGAVLVRRGRVSALGRRFDLQKDSTVTFNGPPETPTLDVTATHKNERNGVKVLVTVKGSPGNLKIGVSAPDRPDLTQSQLYVLMTTGHLDTGNKTTAGPSMSAEAATLVGSLLAAGLQKTLLKRLPLDVLTIQAGQGVTGSSVEAGTYVGDNLYVGYVGRVGADPLLLQNRNAVHVEYQLPAGWSVDAEYGDVGTGTADVLWNKDY